MMIFDVTNFAIFGQSLLFSKVSFSRASICSPSFVRHAFPLVVVTTAATLLPKHSSIGSQGGGGGIVE